MAELLSHQPLAARTSAGVVRGGGGGQPREGDASARRAC
jgi:hypothetical protein